jgi:hypothetical protein
MQNERDLIQNERTLNNDDEKRKFNKLTLNTTEKYMERPSMIDRPNN